MGGLNGNGLFGRDSLGGLASGHVDGPSNSAENGDLRCIAVATGSRIRVNFFDGTILCKDFIKPGRNNENKNNHNGCSDKRLN